MICVKRHSMFDCPEQIQTSPTRMFSSVISFLPRIFISRPSLLAVSESRVTRQVPSDAVVAETSCPAKEMVTFSPAVANPQIGTGRSR